MYFDPFSSWIISLVITVFPWLNEKTQKSLPAEYWANKKLHHKDIADGVSAKEILRRASAGRYYIPKEICQAYPVPRRDPQNNKIIIENSKVYYSDIREHGAYQAQQWAEQGKYNLSEEEMRIESLRIKRKYSLLIESTAELEEIDGLLANSNIDFQNTEAIRQWSKAHIAESKYY